MQWTKQRLNSLHALRGHCSMEALNLFDVGSLRSQELLVIRRCFPERRAPASWEGAPTVHWEELLCIMFRPWGTGRRWRKNYLGQPTFPSNVGRSTWWTTNGKVSSFPEWDIYCKRQNLDRVELCDGMIISVGRENNHNDSASHSRVRWARGFHTSRERSCCKLKQCSYRIYPRFSNETFSDKTQSAANIIWVISSLNLKWRLCSNCQSREMSHVADKPRRFYVAT